MSIVVRLTLLNGLVLLMTLAAFATVSYVAQAQSMQASLDASLRDQVRRFRDLPPIIGDRALARPRVAPFVGPRRMALGPPLVPPDIFVQVTDRDGAVVARSRTLEDDETLPTSTDALQRALAGESWFHDGEHAGQALRIYSAPIGANLPSACGAPLGMVQVARPLAPLQGSLRTLQATFLTVGAAGVLASLLGGWLLARAALRPIDLLAASAHAIGVARDFGKRVAIPSGRRHDEVGRLAEEFNGMLAQLQAAYQQTEAALAAQRRFVADASHELRTPLTSLRGNVDLLQHIESGAPSLPLEEREQILADMSAETDRLGRLVNSLLLLAQADAGQHLSLTPVEVGSIVRDAFRGARFLRQGVALRLGALPANAWVSGSPDRLTQLLLILLDNGLKYSPQGGIVTIEGIFESREGIDGVAIRVTDAGIGIAAADQARIFERFYRADPARGSGGAGLGLPIARWIAAEHGGSIHVKSEPGVGSTFTMWLPSLRTVERTAPTAAPATPASDGREAPRPVAG